MTEGSRSIASRMGIAAIIVSGGVLLSRILGQVRDVIFAAMLGADATTDQYVAAFALPDFLNYLLAGGFLAITFIPIFSKHLANDDEEGGWEALTAILRPIAIVIVALVAIGWIVAPVVLEALFPDFTAAELEVTIRYTRIVLPAQIFFVLGGLFTAVQYSKDVFTIPSLAPIVYNLGIIAGGVSFALVTGEPDPEGFIWGALGGAFVGNFALQWWGARRVGLRLVGGANFRHPALREYLLIALPLMIGQSIVVLDETFMRVFGNLVGERRADPAAVRTAHDVRTRRRDRTGGRCGRLSVPGEALRRGQATRNGRHRRPNHEVRARHLGRGYSSPCVDHDSGHPAVVPTSRVRASRYARQRRSAVLLCICHPRVGRAHGSHPGVLRTQGDVDAGRHRHDRHGCSRAGLFSPPGGVRAARRGTRQHVDADRRTPWHSRSAGIGR